MREVDITVNGKTYTAITVEPSIIRPTRDKFIGHEKDEDGVWFLFRTGAGEYITYYTLLNDIDEE
jgi:hypothetical protein